MFPERILHEQVSINADESEEKNAGVEIGMKHIPVAYTQQVPIYPLSTGITSNQHRKRAQKSQVRDREVEEINVTAFPVLQTEEVAKNNNAIPKDSHNKLDPIKNGKVILFQDSLCHQPIRASCVPRLKRKEKREG